MKTVMPVFGTRPEVVKTCPLVKGFQRYAENFKIIVCVTGQHREMLDQVLQIFDVKPDYDLNIMRQGQDLYDATARVLIGMRDVSKECKPDVVLVHGDTITSTAAAPAASYQRISVGYVGAGLRTHNINSPWPEEMNRQITSRIATYSFLPTPFSESNLLEEQVQGKIFIARNIVINALYMIIDRLRKDKTFSKKQNILLLKAGYDIARLKEGRKLVLITGYRCENFGVGFIHTITAIKDLKNKYPRVNLAYPMHLNLNVRKPIYEIFGEDLSNLGNMFFIEPL